MQPAARSASMLASCMSKFHPHALQTPCDASLSVQGDFLPPRGGPATQGARSEGSQTRALARFAHRSPLLEGDAVLVIHMKFRRVRGGVRNSLSSNNSSEA